MKPIFCWCGNNSLETFSPEYFRCPICETLITAQMPDPDSLRVKDDEQDFYGRNYWFSHQETDLSFSNIRQRARTDLPERDLYWLRTLLKYRRPPARSLELGCSHGGFVALLQWAGFDSNGLELSAWVVEFAHQTFGIPVMHGPLEEQTLASGSLDFIALMDVLEHLPDPAITMRKALELLGPGGFLFIQTPCYPEGKSYGTMLAENDPFLAMLKADEHLYLFSQSAVQRFFEKCGAPYLRFEPAIFARYDMFFLVSREQVSPLTENANGEPSSDTLDSLHYILDKTPGARLVQALLDLQTSLEASERDRQARLEVIQTLDRAYKVTEADRQGRLQDIDQLRAGLAATEADRQARLQQIAGLEKKLVDLKAAYKTQL